VRKLHLYYNNQYQFQLFFIRRLCLLWIDAKIRMILIQKHAVKVPALKMCFYFPQTLKSRHISKNSKCTEASLYEVHTIIQGKKKKHMRCKSWYRLRVIPSQVLAACLVLYLAWMGECKKRLTCGAANKVPPMQRSLRKIPCGLVQACEDGCRWPELEHKFSVLFLWPVARF